MVKIKWKNFSSLIHNFIVLCELLIPCQLFAQKCSNCQEITKISKCSGSPEHSAIGIGYYYITCHSKQLPVGLMVLSDGMVHFLKIKIKKKTNLPKLSCGFNGRSAKNISTSCTSGYNWRQQLIIVVFSCQAWSERRLQDWRADKEAGL